jgi:hypothetical protein
MEHVIGDYETGRIKARQSGTTMSISIRWPFDRSTDEWIVGSIEIDQSDLDSAVLDLDASAVRVDTPKGMLRITRFSDSASFELQGSNSIGAMSVDVLVPLDMAIQVAQILRQHRIAAPPGVSDKNAQDAASRGGTIPQSQWLA